MKSPRRIKNKTSIPEIKFYKKTARSILPEISYSEVMLFLKRKDKNKFDLLTVIFSVNHEVSIKKTYSPGSEIP